MNTSRVDSESPRVEPPQPGELARELEHQAMLADAAQRTVPAMLALGLALAVFPLLPLIGSIRRALRVTTEDIAIASVATFVAFALATLIYRWRGNKSTSYRIATAVETVIVQLSVAFLIHRTAQTDSFFWLLYMAHVVGGAPIARRSEIPLLFVCPVLVPCYELARGGGAAIVGISIAITVLAAFIVTLARQHRRLAALSALAERSLSAQIATLSLENERLRVRRDLHDNVGADLTSLLWELEGVRRGASDEATRDKLGAVAARVRRAIQGVREVVTRPDPAPATVASLREQLNARSEAMRAGKDALAVDIDVAVQDGADPLVDADTVAHVVAIVTEAVRNAIQHGEPTGIAVRCTVSALGELIELRVDDDGGGFDRRSSSGRGLDNLGARARALGCTLLIERLATGTRVDVRRDDR